jgi:hypothetical protein
MVPLHWSPDPDQFQDVISMWFEIIALEPPVSRPTSIATLLRLVKFGTVSMTSIWMLLEQEVPIKPLSRVKF